MSWGKVFTQKSEHFEFQGYKLPVWDWAYWLVQAPLIGIPYRHYYSHFQESGWENVPEGKPIIFAVSHRNAFMDSLAFVNIHDTQVWQLARGDAFNHPILKKVFFFFHMLPIWRERDGVDTRQENQVTFEACYDILYHNGMIGIYPEGDCINERHIRPLKKGICRIAFGAMDKYFWELDLHIVPVGISYSGADSFKKWQLIKFGPAIPVAQYRDMYAENHGNAINKLKDTLQEEIQKLVVHIPRSHHHHDIDQTIEIVSRHNILAKQLRYTPLRKLEEEQRLVQILEDVRHNDHPRMTAIFSALHTYTKLKSDFNFRENTFDKQRSAAWHWLGSALFFLGFLPLFIIGFLTHYLPFKIPQWYVRKNIKQRIFYSSIQYAIGLFLFLFYYLAVLITVWVISGSFLYGLGTAVAMPFVGNFAYAYWRGQRRWWSVTKLMWYRMRKNPKLIKLIQVRQQLLDLVNQASIV